MEWIDRIIGIVAHAENAERGWERVLPFCAEEQPSDLWNALPWPDTRRDVRAAAAWLDEQLDAGAFLQPVRGV